MGSTDARLLLVEDDSDTARGLLRLIQPHCGVTMAATAAAARELLAKSLPLRALIVDDGLPDGSGVDLLAEWRPVYPNTPALVLTGCTEKKVLDAAFDLRAEYLVKPAESSRVLRFLLQPTMGPVPSECVLLSPPPSAGDARSLESCVERLRELQRRPQDARTRYRIGAIVAEVKRRTDLYGVRGVPRLAAFIGEPEQNLYRYAMVADRWSAAAFDAVMLRLGANGQGLSWSHMVVAASVESADRGSRLLEQALRESLSVRALQSIVDRGIDRRDPRSTPGGS